MAERRVYLEQQAARSMGALVGDLTRITSGRDVAEYLVNYLQVDFGADEPSVYPLVHAAAEGPEAARRAGELVTIEPLGYNQVAIAARADGAAADAYTQAIEQHYQRSPYAQRLGDIALRLAQEHTDEPLPRVITTLIAPTRLTKPSPGSLIIAMHRSISRPITSWWSTPRRSQTSTGFCIARVPKRY